MKKVLFFSSVLLAFVEVTLAQSQQFVYNVKPKDAGFDAKRLLRLDSFITQNVKLGKIPNTVTFIARNGKVIHHKAFGWQNIAATKEATTKTIFRNASQTKAITTVAALILYERGYFLLTDPVSKYLPEFKNMQILDTMYAADSSFKSHSAKGEITIQQLMAHTSGIMYDHAIAKKAQIPFFNSLQPITLKDVIGQIAKLPLLHEPGEKFTYGLNTDVLGYLVEKVSGKPLDVFFKEEIFQPLGMVDSYFYLPETKHSRLAELYEGDGEKLKVATNNDYRNFAISGAAKYFSGGAGLVGTIEDYAKFCQMLLNEGSFNNYRILSRKTVQTMIANQIGENTVWGSGNKFGLGVEIITEKGAASILGSLGAYRWGGMYTTDYNIDPTEKLIILFYTNVTNNPYWNLNHINRVLTYQALQ